MALIKMKAGGGKYLTHKNGVEREYAKEVYGSVDEVLKVAQKLDFKDTICSGVLVFEESAEQLTEQLKQESIQLLRETLAPGMQDRVSMVIVEHADKGHYELHFNVAKVDLETGKAYNPYFHAVDVNRFSLVSEYLNTRYELANPNDPLRARTLNIPDYVLKLEAQGLTQKQELEVLREKIDSYISAKFEKGFIESRKDVIETLKDQGFEIHRESKEYLSVRHTDFHDGEKSVRLKGIFYGEDFTASDKIRAKYTEREPAIRENLFSRARELESKLAESNQIRAERNLERYGIRETETEATLAQTLTTKLEKNDLTAVRGHDSAYTSSLSDLVDRQGYSEKMGLVDIQQGFSERNLREGAYFRGQDGEEKDLDRLKELSLTNTQRPRNSLLSGADTLTEGEREILKPAEIGSYGRDRQSIFDSFGEFTQSTYDRMHSIFKSAGERVHHLYESTRERVTSLFRRSSELEGGSPDAQQELGQIHGASEFLAEQTLKLGNGGQEITRGLIEIEDIASLSINLALTAGLKLAHELTHEHKQDMNMSYKE